MTPPPGIARKNSRRWLPVLVLGTFLIGLCFGCGSAIGTTDSSVSGGSGGNGGSGSIFYDNFSGTILGSQWTALNRAGDASNHERQCYSPAQVSVNNLLLLTAINESNTCEQDRSPLELPYTSGAVQWKSFRFTYGTVEVKAKMAGGQGTWPAIWMLGADCQSSFPGTASNSGTCNWPKPGSEEIDIAEVFSKAHTTIRQNLFSSSAPGGSYTCDAAASSDTTQNDHVYQLIWSANSLTWTVDGQTTCSYTSYAPSTPMFLIINVAVGGNGGGSVDPATLPQSSTVDYVKVTQP